MKTAFSIASLAVLLTSASPCFALGTTIPVSKENAKDLGLEVRSKMAGPNQVRVELEFNVAGPLKNFRRVDLSLGEGDNPSLAARLQEDRSKPWHVTVSFTADRAHLDKITLRVTVSEVGDTVYILGIKDFVEPQAKQEAVPMMQYTGRVGFPLSKDTSLIHFDMDQAAYLKYQRLLREGRVKGSGSQLHVGLAQEEGCPRQGMLMRFGDKFNATTGTIQVEGNVSNRDHLLLEGMYIQVRMPFGTDDARSERLPFDPAATMPLGVVNRDVQFLYAQARADMMLAKLTVAQAKERVRQRAKELAAANQNQDDDPLYSQARADVAAAEGMLDQAERVVSQLAQELVDQLYQELAAAKQAKRPVQKTPTEGMGSRMVKGKPMWID
jgi:hypothetical protein